MDNRLVLLVAGLIAATFIGLLIYDNIRRRRLRARGPGRHSAHRPGFFKRTAGSIRDLREELDSRRSRKSRRRERRKEPRR